MSRNICNVCIKPLTAASATALTSLGLRVHLACWRKLTDWMVAPTKRGDGWEAPADGGGYTSAR
jgi:hypothetical protein